MKNLAFDIVISGELAESVARELIAQGYTAGFYTDLKTGAKHVWALIATN